MTHSEFDAKLEKAYRSVAQSYANTSAITSRYEEAIAKNPEDKQTAIVSATASFFLEFNKDLIHQILSDVLEFSD